MVARETAEQVLFVIPFQLTSIHLPCTLIYCMTSCVQTMQFKLTLRYLHLQDAKLEYINTLETISIYADRHETWLWVQNARERFEALLLIPHRCNVRRFARVGFGAA